MSLKTGRSDNVDSFKRSLSPKGGFRHAVTGALRRWTPSRKPVPEIDRNEQPDVQDTKGPLGLNLLHDPQDPEIDFIFVHGLNGGSRKTWSFSDDLEHYWPKEWLSKDADFASVRIHSFGYNADWGEWRRSAMNILDFARSLLGDISSNPEIRRSNTNIVLIGHSMGGIVIKKTYLLAKETPELHGFVNRIHTLYFLATPHRGSGFAATFSNVLTVSFGQKPFVAEISRSSQTVALINDSFSNLAGDLQLCSFYETIPMGISGLVQAIIVDKSSATLGLPNEKPCPLNADHRRICQFRQPIDPNYRTLRNRFSTTIDLILSNNSRLSKIQHDQLVQLTGVSESPDDELLALDDIRVPDTCKWFSGKETYKSWLDAKSSAPPFVWLSGNPGFGKSVLSGYIIHELQREKLGYSYFFFKRGNSDKSSIVGCLRSLAYQMARGERSVLQKLLEVQQNSSPWEKWNEKTIWEKMFRGCIFKDYGSKAHYWVIDAVDECQNSQSFLNLLANIPSQFCLRILFTSRNSPEIERHLAVIEKMLVHYQLKEEDTHDDFSKLIESRMEHVPASHGNGKEILKERILEKASGSFLWVSLVIKRLEEAYSEEQAEEVLNEVPTDMNELYGRMLERVVQNWSGLLLARSVYMWTLLSLRPLSIDALQFVLKLDTNQTVHNLGKFLPAISGQLVSANHQQEAELIHQTAREYLLMQKDYPDLAIHKQECHTRIAHICLSLVTGNFKRGQNSKTHKRLPSSSTIISSPIDFTDYAYEYFSDHLQKSQSNDDQNWDLLCKFFDRHLLVWIEHLAKKGHLRSLTRTSKNLQAYFRRRIKHLSPISPQKSTMETWISDLLRLSARFGNSLIISPSSIHDLIPTMCPSESIFSRYLTSRSSQSGVSIRGFTDSTWDDCLVRIDYPAPQTTSAVACGDQYSAVALSGGMIHVYFQESTQAKCTLNHGERASVLVFSNQDQFLASSGQRQVKVWDIMEGVQLWAFDTSHKVLTMLFLDEESTLAAATQGNYTINWGLVEGRETERWQWSESVRTTITDQRSLPQPSKTLYSPNYNTLAVSYRGLPIYVFDLSTQKSLGLFSRESNAMVSRTSNHYMVDALAFNPSPEINNLVVSYGDGELVVYDLDTTELSYRSPDVFAHSLKCSPDGRTLVTGSSRGTIQIFEFAGARGERLLPLYRINAYEDRIQGLAFSSDSLRFADIRGSQYRLWEPAALICNDLEEGSQSELSHAVTMEMKSVSMLEGSPDPEITSICCTSNGKFVFCGKTDGSVSYFDTSTATQEGTLYHHADGIGITCILYVEKKSLLVTADESGRVLINKISVTQSGCEFLRTAVEIRSRESLSQMLHDDSDTKLLLKSKSSMEIWTIEGAQIVNSTPLQEVNDVRLLANHPLYPDNFLYIGSKDMRIFSWEQSREVDTCRGNNQVVQVTVTPPTPTLQQHQSRTRDISNPRPEDWSPPFLAYFGISNPALPSLNRSTLQIWPFSNLTTSSALPPPILLPKFTNYSNKIKRIITIAGNLLLFLDTDLWICSLDITSTTTILNGGRRHFFLLSEWQCMNRDFILEYVPATREFLIARKHQVLVVSRGLELEESWI